MKYVAIIESDDELSEESIKEIKDTIFVGDEAKYCFEIKSITKAPEPMCVCLYLRNVMTEWKKNA